MSKRVNPLGMLWRVRGTMSSSILLSTLRGVARVTSLALFQPLTHLGERGHLPGLIGFGNKELDWMCRWCKSKITVDGDYSHEIKRHLLLGKKSYDKCRSILKNRDTSVPTKVRIVKAMVFPVVMYGCENWTIKKAEHRRIDAFELWCWRKHLRVPWMARKSNQSILKGISPENSLARLMLKLKKLQYFGHLM